MKVAGRARSFPPEKTPVSVGGHRFRDVVLDDAEGDFPLRAAVFNFDGGAWVLSNAGDRYVVLHAGGQPAVSLPPGGHVGLTGAPFVLSVPGGAVAAEVPVSFGSDNAGAPGMSPWVRLAGSPHAPEVLAPPEESAPARTGRVWS